MYANLTPSVTWSLFRGSSTGDMRGREGGKDSKVWCNIQRGESVMNVQRVGGGGMGQREGGRGRH